MKINRNVIKSIEETKYLSSENTWRYRAANEYACFIRARLE